MFGKLDIRFKLFMFYDGLESDWTGANEWLIWKKNKSLIRIANHPMLKLVNARREVCVR